jgi:hypothetical protein
MNDISENESDGYDIQNDHYMNVPNLEIALGLSWGSYFDKNRYHVTLRAGYEFHVFWDQLNMRKFFAEDTRDENGFDSEASIYPGDTVSRGNLSLNGFCLRLQLDI